MISHKICLAMKDIKKKNHYWSLSCAQNWCENKEKLYPCWIRSKENKSHNIQSSVVRTKLILLGSIQSKHTLHMPGVRSLGMKEAPAVLSF